ncbi:MAG: ABC transporter ATP-binding protein [Ardenticatenaceae bacterium]|nr:ABC transporter ATP-binding protein [Ardenticatenaceae bacterium]
MTSPPALRFENLSKIFGRGKKLVTAVQRVNLEVTAGQVYGFLGPNGAGKSTTIRMILDLIRPTHGEVFVNGRSVQQTHAALQQVGGMVENATFYPFLSGRKNLEVLARTGNYYDAARIDNLLTQVRLADRADHLVKGYSTGMKQRLGLAAALLNDPALVILDEPTNGLDPAGIQEMRTFIRTLVETQGKTVFLSSHLLSEVEQMCDRVAIIHQGQLVREGAVRELLSEQAYLQIEAEPLARATAVLQPTWTITESNAHSLTLLASRSDVPAIVRQLVANDIAIYQIRLSHQSLESFFLEVTGNHSEEQHHA